jgi:hypothetical protein
MPHTCRSRAPEPPAHPVAEPGDLWVLGHHRLLCGDSTAATDVERVLGGVAPHLMVNDPPYGVNYDPAWRNQAGRSITADAGTPQEATRRICAAVVALGVERFDLIARGPALRPRRVAGARAPGHWFRRPRNARWAAQ